MSRGTWEHFAKLPIEKSVFQIAINKVNIFQAMTFF